MVVTASSARAGTPNYHSHYYLMLPGSCCHSPKFLAWLLSWAQPAPAACWGLCLWDLGFAGQGHSCRNAALFVTPFVVLPRALGPSSLCPWPTFGTDFSPDLLWISNTRSIEGGDHISWVSAGATSPGHQVVPWHPAVLSRAEGDGEMIPTLTCKTCCDRTRTAKEESNYHLELPWDNWPHLLF